jgi:hypothetical protein
MQIHSPAGNLFKDFADGYRPVKEVFPRLKPSPFAGKSQISKCEILVTNNVAIFQQMDDVSRSGALRDFNQDRIRPCGMRNMELRLEVEVPYNSEAYQQEE